MATVIELNRIEQVARFREQWRSLLAETPGGTFFQSLEWLETYWRHYGADQHLRVFIVLQQDEVIGIVPCTVRRIPTKVGTCRILTYPLDDWGTFYGPIGPHPDVALTAALEYVQRSRRDWDLIDLRWVHTSGSDGGCTEAVLKKLQLEPRRSEWERTALVDLSGTWEEYLAARCGKGRRTYLRSERRVAQEGKIVHVRHRPAGETQGDADPRWDLYEACEAIAQRSWQGSSKTGTTLSHQAVSAYLRDTHAAAARVGTVDLNLLLLNDRPAAFAYNYYYRGWLHGLRVGYDPSVSTNGLGRLLMGRMIQDSFERGDRVLDLGVGTLECKMYWLTSIETTDRYVHYSPTSVRARALMLGQAGSRWLRKRFGGLRRIQGGPNDRKTASAHSTEENLPAEQLACPS